MGGFLVDLFSMMGSLVICVYSSTPFIILPILFIGFVCKKLNNYYLAPQRECVRLESITTSPIVSGFTSVINGVDTIRCFQEQSTFLQHQLSKT